MYTPKRIFFGVAFLALCVFVGVGIVKTIVRDGPKQIKTKEAASFIDTDEENVIRWERLAPVIKKVNEASLPKFIAPSDGKVTPDQMRRYVDLVFSLNTVMKLDEQRRTPIDPRSPNQAYPISIALSMVRKTIAVAMLIEAEKMRDLKMNSDEHRFIDDSIKKAMALAFKKLSDNCSAGQDIGKLNEALVNACVFAQYSASDDQGNVTGQPERIKPEEIPMENVKLFLQYYPWLEYQTVVPSQFPFDCLAQIEGATKADYNPPVVIHPEDRRESEE